ncbi:MAG TPA: oxidoreductase [Chloroflexi bacterium]|nr:oxidoreductase [Chloroflexota bacterium]
MSAQLRAGVIGVGIGSSHIVGYQAHPAAEVVAIADLNPERLAEVGNRYGITDRYTNYLELLQRPDIDVISVALPNALHAPIARAAIEAGKHVLCEKPLALNAIEAQQIVDTAAAAGRQLVVCFNYRMRPDARWLKAAVDEGKFGQIYLAKAGWLRNTGIPGSTSWFTNRSLSGGGPLIDLGVHMLDLTLWLLGYPDVATVSGVTFAKFGPRGQKAWSPRPFSSGAGTFDVEDLAMALVRFADGRALSLEASWASHTRSGRDDYFITLYGEEAGADLYVANYGNADTVTFYTEMLGAPVDVRPKIQDGGRSHALAVAHFVDRILAGQPVECTGEQGVTLMRIIDAIYESARLGREVALAVPAGVCLPICANGTPAAVGE